MRRFFPARFLAGFVFLMLAGCAAIVPQSESLRKEPPRDLPPTVVLSDVPFYPQSDYHCGPAALAMILNAAGAGVSVEKLVDQVYLPGRKGSLQIEMLAAARRNGLVAYQLAPQLTDVLREVAAGTPVVALENYGFGPFPLWHYSVVVGYDLERSNIVRHSGVKKEQSMPLPVFEYLWEHHWAMVAVPPERMPVTATEAQYLASVSALEQAGQTAGAHIGYRTLLKRWPENLIARMGFGNTAYKLGDLAAAETAFREATLLAPQSAAAFNNLAQTLADRGKLEEARVAAERAVTLAAGNLPVAGETLAAILKKAGSTTSSNSPPHQ